MRTANLHEWTKEELIQTVEVLRRENRTLQLEISRFLTGHATVIRPLPMHTGPGVHPKRPKLDLTRRCP